MGYACPVCQTPQVDAKHLADHLAFTALLGDADHEMWLENHAPGWKELDDTVLADRVVDAADEIDVPVEDAEDAHAPGPDRVDFEASAHDPGVAFDAGADGSGMTEAFANPDTFFPQSEQARAALREAYEMTSERRRRARADESDSSTDGETE